MTFLKYKGAADSDWIDVDEHGVAADGRQVFTWDGDCLIFEAGEFDLRALPPYFLEEE